MTLDARTVAAFTRLINFAGYARVMPWEHRKRPLGMGFGRTRFASPTDAFRLLYVGQTLEASVAEAIVRNRFEGAMPRELASSEMSNWGACEVWTVRTLALLDLRGRGCFDFGISTDVAGGKSHSEAQQFSQTIYDETSLDGIVYKSRLLKDQDCIAVYDRAVAFNLASSPVEELERLANFVATLDNLRICLI